VELHIDQADELSVISGAAVSFTIGFGRLETTGASVLIPRMKLVFREGEEEGYENDVEESGLAMEMGPAFARTLTAENFAFVLMRVAADFASACQELSAVARGGIKVEPARLSYIRACVEQARRHLEECLATLTLQSDANGPTGRARKGAAPPLE